MYFLKSSEDLKSQREREREREDVSRVFQISFICFSSRVLQGSFKDVFQCVLRGFKSVASNFQ